VEVAASQGDAASQPAIGQRNQPGADPVERDADRAEEALLQLQLDTHGARVRFISRLRGKLLHRVKRSAQWDVNPLQELEHVFFSHVSFIARNPVLARHCHGKLRDRTIVRNSTVRYRTDCFRDSGGSCECRSHQVGDTSALTSKKTPHKLPIPANP
jgi:hypothetical protein